MNKREFLAGLQRGLTEFPQKDVEQHLSFYEEMIDDRIEEGFSEEQAVADLGTVDEIVAQIASEIPLKKIVKEKIKNNRRLRAPEIILLILGSPIWLSLLIACFAVALAVYLTLWTAIISLWSVEVSFWACAPASVAAAVIFICQGYPSAAMIMVASGLVCAGLSVFLFFGCRAATKGMVVLTRQTLVRGIKKCFIRKEKIK